MCIIGFGCKSSALLRSWSFVFLLLCSTLKRDILVLCTHNGRHTHKTHMEATHTCTDTHIHTHTCTHTHTHAQTHTHTCTHTGSSQWTSAVLWPSTTLSLPAGQSCKLPQTSTVWPTARPLTIWLLLCWRVHPPWWTGELSVAGLSAVVCVRVCV